MNDQTTPNGPHSDLPAIPPRAPTEEERAALSEWKLLIETSTQEVSESATKWREGLLALVTTASSGLLVIRSTELSTLQGAMFWIVLMAWSTASAAGMIGVWYSLSASAGTPIEIDYSTFARDYGSVEGFRIEQSLHIARTLRTARLAVILSLTLTLIGAFSLHLSHDAAEPKLLIETTTGSFCGSVESADHGEIHLLIDGERDARVFPLSDVSNLSVHSSC
jgi:hypothetical protein